MRCAHCKGDHRYTYEVRDCSARNTAQAKQVEAHEARHGKRKPAAEQLELIDKLMKEKHIVGVAHPESYRQATQIIAWIKRQPARPAPGPVISFVATNLIPDGNYAIPAQDRYVFVRVSRPTSGAYKGHLLIQTRHADTLVRRLVFNPQKVVTFQYNRLISGQRLPDLLAAIVVDVKGSAQKYAELETRCIRCNVELVDPRSIWYGIGPECEKSWPDYLSYVKEYKGEFDTSRAE